jgi:NAD(P)-dependent dehydrogenase (short-subunit alcohol dehydrogenase family)
VRPVGRPRRAVLRRRARSGRRPRPPARGIRAAIGALCAAGGGSIINVASIYGPVGAPGYVAYTASKGAVISMTKVAALEHAADRIRVNAIAPGPVRTPMSEEEGDASVGITPLRRRAEPEEISAAVAFLASDDSGLHDRRRARRRRRLPGPLSGEGETRLGEPVDRALDRLERRVRAADARQTPC